MGRLEPSAFGLRAIRERRGPISGPQFRQPSYRPRLTVHKLCPEFECTVIRGLHGTSTLASLGASGMPVAFKLLLFVVGYNCRVVVAAANIVGIACAAI